LKLLATSIVTSTVVWKNQAIRIKNDGVELVSSDDLKPHVGHKVSLTGMMQGESMGASGFKVTSMNRALEQCAVPDAMMKKWHIAIKIEADRLRVIRY
jgi:hypothetical protein